MKYESMKTAKGNTGVSYISQEDADNQAAEMDSANNMNCYNCSDCSNCSNCSYCYNCSDCSNCSHCSGILIWKGEKTSRLIAINGLKWPIATDGKSIQIGCQNHTVEEWESFNDTRISRMSDGALDFWQQFKPTVIAMATYRRSI